MKKSLGDHRHIEKVFIHSLGHSKLFRRLYFVFCVFLCVLIALIARCVLIVYDDSLKKKSRESVNIFSIFDRKGRVIASTKGYYSVYAHPNNVVNSPEVAHSLATQLSMSEEKILHNLRNKRSFVWIKRYADIENPIKIKGQYPGIHLKKERFRYYPYAKLARHVIGSINHDREGISGLEQYVYTIQDDIHSSIDISMQYLIEDILRKNLIKYSARTAASFVMDIHTGEVYTLSSFFRAEDGSIVHGKNSIMHSVYELGSLFKIVTLYSFLDSFGLPDRSFSVPIKEEIKINNFKVSDRISLKRSYLSPKEILAHSSNVGSAYLALSIGIKNYQNALEKLELLENFSTEIGKTAAPILPKKWDLMLLSTLSYGYGLAINPLVFTSKISSLFNGGRSVVPSFIRLKVSTENKKDASLNDESKYILCAMRECVLLGTCRASFVPGYGIAGKTGTTKRILNKEYSDVNFNVFFVSVFPFNDPQYILFVLFEDPGVFNEKIAQNKYDKYKSSFIAAKTAGEIIESIMPILGISQNKQYDDGQMCSTF